MCFESHQASSYPGSSHPTVDARVHAIPDQYKSIAEVQQALRSAGLESSNLILGIDYTKSNEYTGERTFGGRCLHTILPDGMNPYQRVIDVIGRTLEAFDDDKMIPTFGFGDVHTTNQSVFPFFPDRPCRGVAEVMVRYNQITPQVLLSGPTNFAPLIYKAIEIVRQSRAYHILVIVADGQVVNEHETREAIVAASHFPISIIMIGVGDGPWDQQMAFDDLIPARRFDNFQFVEYEAVRRSASVNFEAAFAMHALMEIPAQFKAIRALNML